MSASVTSSEQDLVTALAELGRDPGQADGGVDLLLCAAGQPRRRRRILDGVEPGDTILVDRQTLVTGPATELDIVLLGAGKVLQGGPKRCPWNHPQIDLHAPWTADARLRGAAQQDVG